MAQTAVEWLDRWYRDNPEATHEEGKKALQQAKQMEKEQIIDAYKADRYPCSYDDAKDYYNDTYTQSGTEQD